MHPELGPVQAVSDALQQRLGDAPATAVVLGSGLGGFVDALQGQTTARFDEVGLPQSTVAGHAGRLVVGTLGAARLVVLSGRVHLYEGRSAGEIVRYVRALHRWGVKRLLLTNSVGGIRDGLDMGELVLVTDHINLQGTNPLIGPAFGTRFPDMSTAYDPQLRAGLTRAAGRVGVRLHEGVLVAMSGPAYETPAEIRMVRALGADVVGMSTVPEVLAAGEIGLRCAVVAVVSNRAAGLSGEPLSHEEVTDAAAIAGVRLTTLFTDFVQTVEEDP
jgi:purine-nucleoside phosphorylase